MKTKHEVQRQTIDEAIWRIEAMLLEDNNATHKAVNIGLLTAVMALEVWRENL